MHAKPRVDFGVHYTDRRYTECLAAIITKVDDDAATLNLRVYEPDASIGIDIGDVPADPAGHEGRNPGTWHPIH